MRLVESRRITGPHLLLARPGAAGEIALEEGEDLEPLRAGLRSCMERLGWPMGEWTERRWTGGVSLAFEAPEDQLETAAWLFDHLLLGDPDWEKVLEFNAGERKPALVAFLHRVRERGLPVFWDENEVTVGLGASARSWPLDQLPDAESVQGSWIPVAFVTGTNGKTTTTRLLARMAAEAGIKAGFTSSDAVVVDGRVVKRGDFTGPMAARSLLRNPEVELAVLETARGGLLRRGLVLACGDVAVVTNISADHLGEWGIMDLEGMAEAKLSIARGLKPGGVLLVNGDVAVLDVAAPASAERFRAPVAGEVRVDGELLATAAEIPIALGGAAPWNLENAVAAATAARRLGISSAAIRSALLGFRPNPADNPGRLNVFERDGWTAVVDFAHNPDGLRNIVDLSLRLPAARRLLVLGQAGDRIDAEMEGLVDEAARMKADLYLLKELPEHRRGKAPGEIPAMLRRLLLARGVPEERIRTEGEDELAAMRAAIAWARAGDLLVLLSHERYEDTVRLLVG